MKFIICSAIITVLVLAFTTVSNAQDKTAGNEQPVMATASTSSNGKTDSLKMKKKNKHKKELADTAYNPYQPGNPVVKPLPYNSYREKPAPVKEGTGAGILKDIITNKKNN